MDNLQYEVYIMYHSIRFIDNLPLYILIATRDMTIKMGKINLVGTIIEKITIIICRVYNTHIYINAIMLKYCSI